MVHSSEQRIYRGRKALLHLLLSWSGICNPASVFFAFFPGIHADVFESAFFVWQLDFSGNGIILIVVRICLPRTPQFYQFKNIPQSGGKKRESDIPETRIRRRTFRTHIQCRHHRDRDHHFPFSLLSLPVQRFFPFAV